MTDSQEFGSELRKQLEDMNCPVCKKLLMAPNGLPGEVFCLQGHFKGYRIPAMSCPVFSDAETYYGGLPIVTVLTLIGLVFVAFETVFMLIWAFGVWK